MLEPAVRTIVRTPILTLELGSTCMHTVMDDLHMVAPLVDSDDEQKMR